MTTTRIRAPYAKSLICRQPARARRVSAGTVRPAPFVKVPTIRFLALESPGGRVVVPATALGRIALARDGRHADVLDPKGDILGWAWASDALALAEDVAIVPAAAGWWVVTAYDDETEAEGVGLQREPVIVWRVDRSASAGGALPVTASWETNQAIDDAQTDGEPYVVLPPEGGPVDCHCTMLGGRGDEALREHLGRLRRGRAAAPGAAPELRLVA